MCGLTAQPWPHFRVHFQSSWVDTHRLDWMGASFLSFSLFLPLFLLPSLLFFLSLSSFVRFLLSFLSVFASFFLDYLYSWVHLFINSNPPKLSVASFRIKWYILFYSRSLLVIYFNYSSMYMIYLFNFYFSNIYWICYNIASVLGFGFLAMRPVGS